MRVEIWPVADSSLFFNIRLGRLLGRTSALNEPQSSSTKLRCDEPSRRNERRTV